ncbi:MAG TPA: hypothetical protein VKU40_03680 [Thermoanaerobaculia bacterium]|nr:hypothetical protein [Thermoanaerobaculia bacterium]
MPTVHRKLSTALSLSLALALMAVLLAAPTAAAQTDVLTIVNDKVGINETSPTHVLHVVDDSGTGGGADQILAVENNGPPRIDQIDNFSNVTFRQTVGLAGATRFYRVIDLADGDIELELRGNGDLKIVGSLIAGSGPSTFPDYVFDDSYELMPLSELATFIEENGHLPNVPTAEQTDDGRQINMTDLQVRLLEKVEELTLYTLQQEKRIAELEARLAAGDEGADAQ